MRRDQFETRRNTCTWKEEWKTNGTAKNATMGGAVVGKGNEIKNHGAPLEARKIDRVNSFWCAISFLMANDVSNFADWICYPRWFSRVLPIVDITPLLLSSLSSTNFVCARAYSFWAKKAQDISNLFYGSSSMGNVLSSCVSLSLLSIGCASEKGTTKEWKVL